MSHSHTPQVVEAVEALEEQRQLLSELQSDVGLGQWNETLIVDLRTAGIVEAWAAGATWRQVRMQSSCPYSTCHHCIVAAMFVLGVAEVQGLDL